MTKRYYAVFFGLKIPMTKHEIMLHAMSLKGGSRTSANCVRDFAYPDSLGQHVIDMAVSQWCTRLRVCVKAKGGHFEHKLRQQFRTLLLLTTA